MPKKQNRWVVYTEGFYTGWVLALVHPGLWLDPGGPDCGASRLEGGLLCVAMGVALLLWSAWRPTEDSPVD